MRTTISYLGAVAATHEVLGVYDSQGLSTNNEASTGNRSVRYEVLCKVCNHKAMVRKSALALGTVCKSCGTAHPALARNRVPASPNSTLLGPWTLFVTDKRAYVVKGEAKDAVNLLPKDVYQEWTKEGKLSQGLMQLAAPVVVFENIIPYELTSAVEVPRVSYDALPPLGVGAPKATNLTEDQLKMLSLYEGHGTVSEEMQADLAFLTPPTAKDFCLMPRKVWEDYSSPAQFLQKYGFDIPEGATTSLAWDVPPWVWVYPPILNEPELPAWD